MAQDEKLTVIALLNQALKEKNCFVPGDIFFTTQTYRNALRLSAGFVRNDKAQAALERLGTLAKEY